MVFNLQKPLAFSFPAMKPHRGEDKAMAVELQKVRFYFNPELPFFSVLNHAHQVISKWCVVDYYLCFRMNWANSL